MTRQIWPTFVIRTTLIALINFNKCNCGNCFHDNICGLVKQCQPLNTNTNLSVRNRKHVFAISIKFLVVPRRQTAWRKLKIEIEWKWVAIVRGWSNHPSHSLINIIFVDFHRCAAKPYIWLQWLMPVVSHTCTHRIRISFHVRNENVFLPNENDP